jgi:ABC-type multidrug transport system ATPase subunit
LGAFDDLVLRREAAIDAVRDAIRCHGLTKRFRGKAAVDGLDLQVAEGEVFGFLGPNGAGKTTTIRLLLGLLRADAGQAWLLGERVPCPIQLAQVGAMVEEPAFYPWMSGRRNLRILAKTGAPVAKHAVEEALARAGLSAVAGRKVKAYSQGMRQRLGLAVALLRRPRLLLLDEPATGLDPAGIREFRTLVRELAGEGVTVFLSSHLLGEVEQVCDRVAIIDQGQLVAVGTTADLGRGEERVRVTVRPDEEPAAIAVLADAGLTARREGERPGTLLVDSASGRDVNMALARGEIFAEAVGLARSGLEERFLAIINRSGVQPTGAAPWGSPDASGPSSSSDPSDGQVGKHAPAPS